MLDRANPEELETFEFLMRAPFVREGPRGSIRQMSLSSPIDDELQDDLDAREQCNMIEREEYEAASMANCKLGITLWASDSVAWLDPAAVQRAFRAFAMGERDLEWYRRQCGSPLPLTMVIVRNGVRHRMG